MIQDDIADAACGAPANSAVPHMLMAISLGNKASPQLVASRDDQEVVRRITRRRHVAR